jgi:hypothetical protein
MTTPLPLLASNCICASGFTPTADHLDAAEEYERLAKTVQAVADHLLVAYSQSFEDLPDSERWQEMLKDIFRGFSPTH